MRILDSLVEKPYWKYYLQRPFEHDTIKVTDKDEVHFGDSRGCFLNADDEYVVKFELTHDWDDCAREQELYEEAVAAGLGDMFAASHFIGNWEKQIHFYTFDDIEKYGTPDISNDDWVIKLEKYDLPQYDIKLRLPLYRYEKVQLLEDWDFNIISKKERDYCLHTNSPLAGRDRCIAACFLRDWGIEKFLKLSDFCNEWDIDDLHRSNVGILRGRIVICDYAGANYY